MCNMQTHCAVRLCASCGAHVTENLLCFEAGTGKGGQPATWLSMALPQMLQSNKSRSALSPITRKKQQNMLCVLLWNTRTRLLKTTNREASVSRQT